MAVDLLAGQSPSVRCAICAQPARRGATLCEQCKAAVQRARHVPSVRSEHIPHPVSLPSSMSPAGRSVPHERPARGSRAGTSPILGGWATYATLIAFGLAVCLTGYLAMGDYANGFSARPETPATGTPAAARSEGASRQMPSLAVDAEVPAAGVAAEDLDPLPAMPAARASSEHRPSRDAKASVPFPPLDARDVIESGPKPAVPEPARVVIAATTPEPAAPDRWQLLASALANCDRENFIAGLVCKERARLQYCEGEWGKAPQCPAGAPSSNTR